MKFFLLALTQLIIISSLFSQQEVRGLIETDQGVLEGASILVLSNVDSTMLAYGLTNESGIFRIKDVPRGEHVLIVSFMGHDDIGLSIEVKESKVDLGVIKMTESSTLLPVVKVKAEHIPLGINGDTLNYNVAAFGTKPGESVEDLLKKLPGIEVARDGSIKAQGEDVENVLVDGKEFFSGDPQIATKNLEAQALDKVQVFDKKSEHAEFTGIDDGNEERSINLKLKEDYKNGGFGKVEAHVGNKQTHRLGTNYHRFGSKTQVSFLGNKNNINENAFSFRDYVTFMGGLGNLIQGGGINSLQGGMFSQGGQIEGLTDKLSVGTNLNLHFSKKLKWYSNYFLATDKRSKNESIIAHNFSNDFEYLSLDTSQVDNSIVNHRFNSKLTYKLNERNELILSSKGSQFGTDVIEEQTRSYFIQDQLNSRTINKINTNGKKLDIDLSAIYKLKFEKKGRNWISDYKYLSSDEQEDLGLNNRLLSIDSVLLVDQFQEFNNHPQIHQFSSKFTEGLGNKYYIGLGIKYNEEKNSPNKLYYNVKDQNKIFDPSLSGDFYRRWNKSGINISFRKNTKRVKINAALDMLSTELQAYGNNNTKDILYDELHYLPFVNFKFDLKGAQSLDVTYRTELVAPRTTQLLTFPNNLNINILNLGNPNLIPELNQRLSLYYNYFNEFNFTNIFMQLDAVYSNNKIVYTSDLQSDLTLIRKPINTTSYRSIRSNLNHSNPIRRWHMKYNIEVAYTYDDYDNIVDGIQNDVSNSQYHIDVRIENRNKKYLDMAGGFSLDRSIHKNSIHASFDQDFDVYTWYTDLEIDIAKKLVIGLTYDYRSYNISSFTGNADNHIVTFYSKLLMLNKKMTLEFKAVDVFDQNIGYDRSSTVTSLQESKFNTLGRYFMIGASYKIGKVKK